MTQVNDLSETVRRVDEDRWLASRFAPADVRGDLIALYALNYELARTAEVVSQPTLGDIRLAWWRDATAEIYEGRTPRAHPVVDALARSRKPWPRQALEDLIEARARDLDATPFQSEAAFGAYLDATAGKLMRLGLIACGAEMPEAFITQAARAWGGLGFVRNRRTSLVGVSKDDEIESAMNAYARIRTHAVPADAFPAIGYLALTPGYAAALKTGSAAPLLFRQLKLVAASATGRL
jgi:15-cis-phytoene synthase